MTLTDLERALVNAEQGSRELDLVLSKALLGEPSLTPLSQSIDAALALVFRVLTPLGFLSWGIDGTQKDYNVGWVAVYADGGLLEGRGESHTPALALCLALVRALQSQSKKG